MVDFFPGVKILCFCDIYPNDSDYALRIRGFSTMMRNINQHYLSIYHAVIYFMPVM